MAEAGAAPAPAGAAAGTNKEAWGAADAGAPSVIHSVSLAQFDLALGNTISQTRPAGVCLEDDVVQTNLHDLCFPDGAHSANRDTVYAVLDRKDGRGQLYAVGCYRALKTDTVSRGAVQRGMLVLTTEPLFNTLATVLHDLLQWWLVSDEEGGTTTPVFGHGNISPRADPSDASGDLSGWVDVVRPRMEVLEGRPRNPSTADDELFLDTLHAALVAGIRQRRADDRQFIIPFNFDYYHERVVMEDDDDDGAGGAGYFPGQQSPASMGSPTSNDQLSPRKRMQRVFDRMKMVGLVGGGAEGGATPIPAPHHSSARSFGSPGSTHTRDSPSSPSVRFSFNKRRVSKPPGGNESSTSPTASPRMTAASALSGILSGGGATSESPPGIVIGGDCEGTELDDVASPPLDAVDVTSAHDEDEEDAVAVVDDDACPDAAADDDDDAVAVADDGGNEDPCDASMVGMGMLTAADRMHMAPTRGRSGGLLEPLGRVRTITSSKKMAVELCAPYPSAPVPDQLGYGCCLSHLVRTFRHRLSDIYSALLHRQTICFVGFGNAKDVGACVLACCHLVRPIPLPADTVVPYFTVTDASKIEKLPFCVCGTTNPFFEDPNRNKWAAVICNVSDGSVTVNRVSPVPRRTTRFIGHVVQGVVDDGRTEAWVRNFFEWHTAKTLRADGNDAYPLAAGCEGFEFDARCVDRCERITSTVTACHEVNKRKTSLHAEWFSTMLEVLRPVAMRSGDSQKDMYCQIAGFDLAEALGGFTDVTLGACGSRTERAVVAQLAYEEQKTRQLLTEVRERVALLVDVLNRGNRAAAAHEDNQLFTDIFNTLDFQFYNIPSQILLFSTSCSVESRVLQPRNDGGPATVAREPISKAACKVYISRHYICLFANWRSRVGKVWADATSPSEVIPFDAIDAVETESSVVSDGIRISLSPEFSGDGARYVLFLHDSKDVQRLFVLVETLIEKQRRTRTLLEAIDPVLEVPDILTKGPLGIPRRLVIPTGLYLYDRIVDEEVFELSRSYPMAGWCSKLLPHDPPQFCDKSGKFERQFADERKANHVELPRGWIWLTEWACSAWEYNSDFKSKPYAWKAEGGKMDMCRRRKWTRTRRLEHDRLGTPLYVIGGGSPMAAAADDSPREALARTGSPAIPLPSPKAAAAAGGGSRRESQCSPASFAMHTRCRQSVPNLEPELDKRVGGLSSGHFTPPTLFPQLAKKLETIELNDFRSPAGTLSPFHASASLPGCGATRYQQSLPGHTRDQLVLDELMAETSGMSPCVSGSSPQSNAQYPQRGRRRKQTMALLTGGGGGTPSPSAESPPQFNFSFQNDGGLLNSPPPQQTSTSFNVLSRGVLLLDAQEAENNMLAAALASSRMEAARAGVENGSPVQEPLPAGQYHQHLQQQAQQQQQQQGSAPPTPRSARSGSVTTTPPMKPLGLSAAVSGGLRRWKDKLKGASGASDRSFDTSTTGNQSFGLAHFVGRYDGMRSPSGDDGSAKNDSAVEVSPGGMPLPLPPPVRSDGGDSQQTAGDASITPPMSPPPQAANHTTPPAAKTKESTGSKLRRSFFNRS